MPTYEYRCPDGHDFERFFRKISDAPAEVACSVCGKIAERRMSAGAGLVFKGSGFYLTDYGKNAHRKGGDAGSGSGESSGESKGESKAESKGESASGGESKPAEKKGGEGAAPKPEAKSSEAKPAAPAASTSKAKSDS
jgi:putative FmdB family regulatory protein